MTSLFVVRSTTVPCHTCKVVGIEPLPLALEVALNASAHDAEGTFSVVRVSYVGGRRVAVEVARARDGERVDKMTDAPSQP